ncbi:hypothetical protein BA_1920 [Bacillus anthracis str. Ames]|uniref:Uncharacterized protein n=2 Tax=Bacillus anthracis TaxID=1392 RepID=A0A2P0HCX0_BACAN|nr:hypothetical protein BA_1920 [Bacillus anthracis str. Ames]AAT31040.2 hypothetical protein GBAA_1920 [Bacillus anthracis str. 'Ames Ancestor']APT25422.1 hypothetical protein BVB96_09925 [Bacillus anthracis]EDR16626.1 hypothetical protein BAC_1938 [Bacillus anthracis str. A0488]EDR88991.1 hypothetical protein BAQ_1967 [Bacillus anthracis str. A0193]EDR94512.1 hypothetical protein BAH_1966 [Bacillus anthracis str. A0442]EDS97919.1 hypothetical protein BAK_1997 [Bacillus anthracis str. A0389]
MLNEKMKDFNLITSFFAFALLTFLSLDYTLTLNFYLNALLPQHQYLPLYIFSHHSFFYFPSHRIISYISSLNAHKLTPLQKRKLFLSTASFSLHIIFLNKISLHLQ